MILSDVLQSKNLITISESEENISFYNIVTKNWYDVLLFSYFTQGRKEGHLLSEHKMSIILECL